MNSTSSSWAVATPSPWASRRRKRGGRSALIERDLLGGTCPNRGCIPSKLLLGFAEVATTIREAHRFYLQASFEGLDGPRILDETMNATLRATDPKIQQALPDGVTLFRGEGRFVEEGVVEVAGERVRGRKTLIATGTRPRPPSFTDLEGMPYWTSDDVFSLETLPESISIIGGGYIACELAHFFSSMGVDTTMVVRRDQLMRAEDRDIRRVFTEAVSSRLDIRFNSWLDHVEETEAGIRQLIASRDGTETDRTTEALLFAIGRIPNCDEIGLENTGVERDESGFIVVDDHLRTTSDDVYALGDVKGQYLFTHAAAFEATYLAGQLLDGDDDPLSYGPMPHAVFGRPEIAGVGATEDELERDGVEYLVGSAPYSSAAKGRALKEEHGLCKFLVAKDGSILGLPHRGSRRLGSAARGDSGDEVAQSHQFP